MIILVIPQKYIDIAVDKDSTFVASPDEDV